MARVQVEKVVKETEELKKRQATPDSPEALSCIPSLQLSDIPKQAAPIPTAVSTTAAGATLLTHDLFTNNVLYADVALPLTRVPARLLPLLPLFCRCVLRPHGRAVALNCGADTLKTSQNCFQNRYYNMCWGDCPSMTPPALCAALFSAMCASQPVVFVGSCSTFRVLVGVPCAVLYACPHLGAACHTHLDEE